MSVEAPAAAAEVEEKAKSYALIDDGDDEDETHEEQSVKAVWGKLTKVTAKSMVDGSEKSIRVPAAWTKYKLEPKFVGEAIFLDAQDVSFYEQELPNPRYRVWILIKAALFKRDVGYVKKRLVEEALRRNVQVRLVAPHRFDLSVNKVGSKSIVYFGRRLHIPHVVVTRLGAASDYFGLAVLRQLRALGVPILNGNDGVSISRDKLLTAQILAENSIPIPRTIISMYPFDGKFIATELGFPLIVKKVSGARGEAVWKVDTAEELALLSDTLVERDRKLRSAKTVAEEEAAIAEVQALAPNAASIDDDNAEGTEGTETTDASNSQFDAPHWFRDYPHSDRRLSAVALATAPSIESLEKIVCGHEGAPTTDLPAFPTPGSADASKNASEDAKKESDKEEESDHHEQKQRALEKFLSSPFVFQQFVAHTKGRDLRVMVVRGKVIGAMMRKAAAGGFKANVHQGGAVEPVEVGDALREISIETAKCCQLDIAGVDLMMAKSTYVVCEVNSSPGFEGLERATASNIGGAMMESIISVAEQHVQQHAAEATAPKEKKKKKKARKYPLQDEHK